MYTFLIVSLESGERTAVPWLSVHCIPACPEIVTFVCLCTTKGDIYSDQKLTKSPCLSDFTCKSLTKKIMWECI